MIDTPPTQHETLVQTMQRLKEEGYRHDFQFIDGEMKVMDTEEVLRPDDVIIRSIHRFEGATNPADSSILYAMETRKGLWGLFVSAYGAYAAEDADEFIKQVDIVE
ncbi:MAG: hypothetical protein AAF738_03515 [Bacteroidota bacterium]